MAALYPVVNLVWQPDGVVNGNKSINAFYRECVESKTIYFKLDDDIVWMEPGLIEKMVEFRVSNPRYFVVSPLVINNSLSTYLLQTEGKLRLKEYCNADSSHPILWRSGRFAADLHDWFISNYLLPNKWTQLHMGAKPMGMTRFSINSILWFGDEMKKFNGEVPGDDEEFCHAFILPVKVWPMLGTATLLWRILHFSHKGRNWTVWEFSNVTENICGMNGLRIRR